MLLGSIWESTTLLCMDFTFAHLSPKLWCGTKVGWQQPKNIPQENFNLKIHDRV